MAEPREMWMMGRPEAVDALQTPEIAAKISERSCPVGWELELVSDAETGEPWGYCDGCKACWRLRKGVVESVRTGPRVALYGECPDEVILDEPTLRAEAVANLQLKAGDLRPVSLEWRATPDEPGVPLEIEEGSFAVTWGEVAAAAISSDEYASGGAKQAIRSAWLSARQWQRMNPPLPASYRFGGRQDGRA